MTNIRTQQRQDKSVINELVTYLSQRNPFSADPSLRSITTGVVAGEDVNADKAKEVGEKVLCSMLGKTIHDHSFQKKDQVQTLASQSAVRFSEGSIQVDPQLLFQRLTVVARGGWYKNPQAFFKFETCSYPPALFDSSLLPRQASTSQCLLDNYQEQPTGGPTGNVHFVLDGWALLHRVPWPRGITYDAICSFYV